MYSRSWIRAWVCFNSYLPDVCSPQLWQVYAADRTAFHKKCIQCQVSWQLTPYHHHHHHQHHHHHSVPGQLTGLRMWSLAFSLNNLRAKTINLVQTKYMWQYLKSERNRIQNFLYWIFMILGRIPNFFDTKSYSTLKIEKFLNRYITLWTRPNMWHLPNSIPGWWLQ